MNEAEGMRSVLGVVCRTKCKLACSYTTSKNSEVLKCLYKENEICSCLDLSLLATFILDLGNQ